MKPHVIASLGKGGAGKTAISTMLGRYMIEKGLRPLFIDADPVSGLQKTLGIGKVTTIAEARRELVKIAQSANREDDLGERREDIEFIIMQVLREEKDFGFMAIGQNNATGCFCSINTLLRRTLSSIINEYDVVIIDAEAGIEQVYRQVVENINHAILVTDISKRGVDACVALQQAMLAVEAMKNCSYGTVFNKTSEAPAIHREYLALNGINISGCIPMDNVVADFDSRGESLFNIPTNSVAFSSLKKIADSIMR